MLVRPAALSVESDGGGRFEGGSLEGGSGLEASCWEVELEEGEVGAAMIPFFPTKKKKR